MGVFYLKWRVADWSGFTLVPYVKRLCLEVDAQTGLGLRWSHMSYGHFLFEWAIRRPVYLHWSHIIICQKVDLCLQRRCASLLPLVIFKDNVSVSFALFNLHTRKLLGDYLGI